MQTAETGTDILMGDARKRVQPRVIIGISTYNAENVIERIVASLNPIADEIVVCDDASTDSTAKVAESLNCKMIIHPHHLGSGAALRSLFLAANQDHADVLLTVATDTICNSSDLSKLVDSVARNEADIAVGSRFPLKPAGATEGFGRSVGTVFGLPVQDPKSPFKAYGKSAIEAVVSNSLEKSDILPEARKLDLGIMEYEVTAKPLFTKEDNRNRDKSSKIGPVGRMVDFTAVKHPLAFYSIPSILSLLGALFVSYLTYAAWTGGAGVQLAGVLAAMTLFIVWVVLGVTGAILHSLSSNRKTQTE